MIGWWLAAYPKRFDRDSYLGICLANDQPANHQDYHFLKNQKEESLDWDTLAPTINASVGSGYF